MARSLLNASDGVFFLFCSTRRLHASVPLQPSFCAGSYGGSLICVLGERVPASVPASSTDPRTKFTELLALLEKKMHYATSSRILSFLFFFVVVVSSFLNRLSPILTILTIEICHRPVALWKQPKKSQKKHPSDRAK
ncbi:unnamed protein product [Mortierella alpina]